MINEIKINGIATFTEPATMKPLKINFCYGSNGSGKTTISSVISECPATGATVSWSTSDLLQTLVYNRDFVSESFGETSKIGGIFTLGKDSKEAQEFIVEQRTKVDECDKQIEGYGKSKEELEKQQKKRVTDFDDACWKVKGKYENDFGEAFNRLNASKKVFRERCVTESRKATTAPSLDELKRQYGIAFGEARPVYAEFEQIDIAAIERWEQCELLAQKISGSADTPIGKFIEFLGNSDWVKQGIPYADTADGKCPFCQQELPHDTYEDIKAFFDDSYERDLNQIRAFLTRYSDNTSELLAKLRGCIDTPLPIFDYALFKAELDTLVAKVGGNVKEIERKVGSPSVTIKLEPLRVVIERINAVFIEFNKAVAESNDFAKNQNKKQTECVNGVWQIVVSELKTVIDTFDKDTAGNTTGIGDLEEKISGQKEQKKEHLRLIAEKEETLTSVKPTADAINSILSRFGFEGFSLIENPDELGTYKIVRNNGKNVEKSLSEGEYNFICFLYFYHLVYGSQDKTGIAQSKVVVIDDPISSLDSNVLFIVSTLAKQIVDDCKNNRGGIKQVFILTHNVYFHKEVTFLGSRKDWKKNEAGFWIVKKNNNISHIVSHDNKNPIQTSYELLWSELKDTESAQRITVFNTLRRILEYYFNVIGGLDYEKCINEFDGEDKLICKSLIACINEGSHFITDDFVMQYESAAMENYIRVFELIFKKMGHSSHYNMMMGIDPETENGEEPVHGQDEV
jgi:wobble nucleotide-excising tRNase